MKTTERVCLAERASNIPLYLHAYAFHLNMRYERILPGDLLDIAHQHQLQGVKIHVEDGETQALQMLSDHQLFDFRKKAEDYGLDVNIETSASDKKTLDDAIRIARATGASSVRFYPRYEGHLQDVMEKIALDIQYLSQFDDCGLTFTIEQHEDLKGEELVSLVKQSGMKNLSILFDFGNMINANEKPLDALNVMAPYITQVHVKDAKIIQDGSGWAHEACRSGHGDLPMEEMIRALLLLGEDKPQVISFGLEEEVDYFAPAFRFDDEGDNPWIPWRTASYTPLPDADKVDARLAQESEHAIEQIHYVRNICNKFINEN
ncbi:sugar phosphate isomerase/epimerase family protein [Citrobacter enshiensis]|uniref:sugar phosphate isomerase/epimerase family protein n=1 Tax=Citrobacter enshiensis TaxID=2971264 RepID=UPI0023E88E50|nr:TIM barrel protein [Citrobacter enshiensis]WET40144.1 TIM barrel protein [Citrobacter enshiensis]